MARAILRTISSGTARCWVRSIMPARPHMRTSSTLYAAGWRLFFHLRSNKNLRDLFCKSRVHVSARCARSHLHGGLRELGFAFKILSERRQRANQANGRSAMVRTVPFQDCLTQGKICEVCFLPAWRYLTGYTLLASRFRRLPVV